MAVSVAAMQADTGAAAESYILIIRQAVGRGGRKSYPGPDVGF